jgi:hypothetical protein
VAEIRHTAGGSCAGEQLQQLGVALQQQQLLEMQLVQEPGSKILGVRTDFRVPVMYQKRVCY